MGEIWAVILAAGRKENAFTPSYCIRFVGVAMLGYILPAAPLLPGEQVIIVTGRGSQAVREAMGAGGAMPLHENSQTDTHLAGVAPAA